MRIDMDRHEQVGIVAVRVFRPFFQLDEDVAIPRHEHADSRLFAQQFFELQSDFECDVLLFCLAQANRTGVFPSMAWVDDDGGIAFRRRRSRLDRRKA